MRNYSYLFWGYSVVWLGIAAYLLVMFAKLRGTRRRLESLENEVRRLEAGSNRRADAP